MYLLDTNVLIDFMNNRNPILTALTVFNGIFMLLLRQKELLLKTGQHMMLT